MTDTPQTSVPPKRPALRLTLCRNDLAVLIGALESVIEDYKYDGGLVLAEDELNLLERLQRRLQAYDQGRA